MPRMNMFKPTAVPQTFRISLANRSAMETVARAAGTEFSTLINEAMSRYFWEDHRSIARANGIEAPATAGRRG